MLLQIYIFFRNISFPKREERAQHAGQGSLEVVVLAIHPLFK